MAKETNNKKEVFFHLHLLELKVLPPPGVGIYLQVGPDPGVIAFQGELVKLMAKYRVVRVDAIMVPCDRSGEQVIRLEMAEKKDKEESEQEEQFGDGGPGP